MARENNFPYDLKTDGYVSLGNGLEARRRTGIVRVVGSAVSHAVLTPDGAPLTLEAGELVTYLGIRLGHGLALASAGVVKVGLASNGDATAAAIAATLRTDDATPLAAATTFDKDASGYALIVPATPVAATAGALQLFGRDAAAAGTADVAVSPGADAPDASNGVSTALVVVEVYSIARKAPLAFDEVFLPKADQTLQTRVIEQVA